MQLRRWTYNLMTDEALMQSYSKGYVQAFDTLYLRHKRALYLFLLRQINDRGVCEEIVSDTWMAVIKQAGCYTPTAKFKTWLYRIANNRLVDFWRSRRFKEYKTAYLYEELLSVADVRQRAEDDIEIEQLANRLKMLNADQLNSLLLKIEGFSLKEIAEITNTKEETAKSRVRYASNKLKRRLAV